MFRDFWPPAVGPQHSGQAPQQPQETGAGPETPHRRQKRSPLAVISGSVRFLGRGVGATASGVSTVVQTPVRAARGLRHRDTAPPTLPQPEPEPEPAKKRTAWDG
jgi:hypothetical protein